MKIHSIVGARPNFMKIAPIHEILKRHADVTNRIVHTGQHYDVNMSDVFFEDLDLPAPDVHLGVGSGGHGEQTGRVMVEYERVALAERPDLILVVGDVNSTLAAALVGAKLHIPVAHVEAGLRSFDESMPEEINRRLTDAVSRHLFVTEEAGMENLKREGIDAARCHLVGNVAFDTLLRFRERARARGAAGRLGVKSGAYALVTLHRPGNVDSREELERVLSLLEALPVDALFPIHPRTRKCLDAFGLAERAERAKNLHLVEPVGYLDFLSLATDAKLVLTDSGGLQSESSLLGVPCLILRETTEHRSALDVGTAELVGRDSARALRLVNDVLSGSYRKGRPLPLADGKASERIVEILLKD